MPIIGSALGVVLIIRAALATVGIAGGVARPGTLPHVNPIAAPL